MVTFRGGGSYVAPRYLGALPVAIIAALAGSGAALPESNDDYGRSGFV